MRHLAIVHVENCRQWKTDDDLLEREGENNLTSVTMALVSSSDTSNTLTANCAAHT